MAAIAGCLQPRFVDAQHTRCRFKRCDDETTTAPPLPQGSSQLPLVLNIFSRALLSLDCRSQQRFRVEVLTMQ